MSTAAAHDVTAALIAYRKKPGGTWLTLADLTCDLMHLASYMHTDIDRCLSGETGARLDERALSAMPNVHKSVRPLANPDDAASVDHCFDGYVHASDAAAVLRVHTAEDTHITFSAALTKLLADLRAYADLLGLDFADITRSARKSYQVDKRKAQ
ncbi:hypothetical protein ACFY1P_19880 [Streptomyces sp. NPDC001407]|uniref:hypothetical protein n=1 Tax=Streptomyces sp. NPDC001407 TaxID=3364573 RepID=UPI00367F439B